MLWEHYEDRLNAQPMHILVSGITLSTSEGLEMWDKVMVSGTVTKVMLGKNLIKIGKQVKFKINIEPKIPCPGTWYMDKDKLLAASYLEVYADVDRDFPPNPSKIDLPDFGCIPHYDNAHLASSGYFAKILHKLQMLFKQAGRQG